MLSQGRMITCLYVMSKKCASAGRPLGCAKYFLVFCRQSNQLRLLFSTDRRSFQQPERHIRGGKGRGSVTRDLWERHKLGLIHRKKLPQMHALSQYNVLISRVQHTGCSNPILHRCQCVGHHTLTFVLEVWGQVAHKVRQPIHWPGWGHAHRHQHLAEGGQSHNGHITD